MSPVENQPNLPPSMPMSEQLPAASGQSPEQAANTPEHVPAGAEQGSSAGQAMAPMPTSIPLPTLPVLTNTDVAATTNNPTPAVADDGDLIEKEWVDKAKKIVEANRDNPYAQSEGLTVVKADYLQKRYNKTVKLNK
jgi:hypothetical protein